MKHNYRFIIFTTYCYDSSGGMGEFRKFCETQKDVMEEIEKIENQTGE